MQFRVVWWEMGSNESSSPCSSTATPGGSDVSMACNVWEDNQQKLTVINLDGYLEKKVLFFILLVLWQRLLHVWFFSKIKSLSSFSLSLWACLCVWDGEEDWEPKRERRGKSERERRRRTTHISLMFEGTSVYAHLEVWRKNRRIVNYFFLPSLSLLSWTDILYL